MKRWISFITVVAGAIILMPAAIVLSLFQMSFKPVVGLWSVVGWEWSRK